MAYNILVDPGNVCGFPSEEVDIVSQYLDDVRLSDHVDRNFELVKNALVLPGRTYVTNASGHPTKFYRRDLHTTAQRWVDVARITANEMKMIASSGHHLGNKTPSTLAFLGMIMGLCQKASGSLPTVVHETIDGEVNDSCRSGSLMLIISLLLETNLGLMLISLREGHFNRREQLVLKWKQVRKQLKKKAKTGKE
ncbi:hypothetical protein KIW84_073262 [Lathyrus oleraceus]|uniref:Uncharacterized protein n=1 Tax=Pisum sativum TaxID=3888 RepID=A0A9D4VNZ3_PEA|nr:hypothetical protein KIW84_073262 [Pisum sativum]